MNEAKWQGAIALGHVARHRSRREEALTHYRAALALAPDHAETPAAFDSAPPPLVVAPRASGTFAALTEHQKKNGGPKPAVEREYALLSTQNFAVMLTKIKRPSVS
jgi:hypothetical protein